MIALDASPSRPRNNAFGFALAAVKPALVLAVLIAALAVAGCGKRGAPSPPGPPDQVTWPRIYPTR